MASTIVNTAGPTSSPTIQRNRPFNIGTISGTGQAVQFTVTGLTGAPNGFCTLVIFTTGNLVAATPVLECSIDGGATWAQVVAPTNASSSTTFSVTTLNSDPAASTANGYTIAGLQGYAQFRFGFTTFTSGSGACWIALSGS